MVNLLQKRKKAYVCNKRSKPGRVQETTAKGKVQKIQKQSNRCHSQNENQTSYSTAPASLFHPTLLSRKHTDNTCSFTLQQIKVQAHIVD